MHQFSIVMPMVLRIHDKVAIYQLTIRNGKAIEKIILYNRHG